MKGFKIHYNREEIKVAVQDGMATIHAFDNNGDSHSYIGSVDYNESQTSIWQDFIPLNIGDKLEIELIEIEESSKPVKIVENNNISRPKSKLEMFIKLENDLKKRGLL